MALERQGNSVSAVAMPRNGGLTFRRRTHIYLILNSADRAS